MQRENRVLIRVRLLMLYYFILSIDLYVHKRYKRPFWILEDGPVTGLVSPVWSILLLSFSG